MKFQDLTGKVFGFLTVLEKDTKNTTRHIHWLCKCQCGNIVSVSATHLKTGHTKSCGCKVAELCRKANLIHNGSYTKEFTTWCGIKQRCLYKKHKGYKNYGGRGIKICKEWLNFENFLKDIGRIPKGYSVDRINVNGNYEPSNCRLIPLSKQARNKRSNLIVTYNNETDCLINLCDKYHKKYDLVYQRIHNGWDIKRAFEQKKQEQRKK